jgi:exodeoxyribonuclease V alpha subunit
MIDTTQELADGFAAQVQRWAVPSRADMACEVARQLSLATSQGHVCITVDAATAQALAESGVAGTADAPGSFPLIVDPDRRVYLHRYFDYESRLARRLRQAADAPPREPRSEALDRLELLFPPGGDGPDMQKAAAALALRRGLVVVSGGPGTGKTTTVVNLLACILEQDPASRVALAAPTGKAAARMTEAIRLRAGHLPQSLRDRLPQEASTIHRLLRYRPSHGFSHGKDNPLPVDLLVVDEASMLDLAMATRLLEAVPPSARVVLIGDKDQLAAVESGAVFAELASLRDIAVWLTRNYRFVADSGIGRLAADINAGRADEAVAWLRGAGGEVTWHESGSTLPHLEEGFARYFEVVSRDVRDVCAIHEAFGRFRVLCAVRAGEQGVEAVNEAATALARQALADVRGTFESPPRSPWYPGRPVMVTLNDYGLKLFNGDVGIALPDAKGEAMVWFPDEAGGWRGVAPARMPQHETAFAMTVHKSQGSEFDDVLVVLPPYETPVLTRELLYTAVTRAKRQVTLLSPESAVRTSIQRKVERASGLLARLLSSTS